MAIDKALCTTILNVLAQDYPGTMSNKSWETVTTGQESIQKVAACFQYLEEKGYIDTHIQSEEQINGEMVYYITLPKTKINAYGIDFLENGGFNI